MSRIKQNDLFVFFTVLLTSVVVTFLKFKGIVNFKYENNVILFNMCIIFIYIIFSLNDIKKLLSEKDDHIIEGETLDAQEFYRKLRQSVSKAKKSIDLMSMRDSKPDEMSGVVELKDYFENIEKIIKRNNSIQIRRIVSIGSETKFDWVCETIKKFKEKNNFSMRYMKLPSNISDISTTPYPLNVQIIDGKEIFIINPKQGYMVITGKSKLNIRIKSDKIGEVLTEYYDACYDNKCEVIFEGKKIYTNRLKEIMKDLGINKQLNI